MKYTRKNMQEILDHLASRTDTNADRIKRLMQMPDLSGLPNTPVYHIVEAVKKAESLENHDLVEFPEIVSVEENFDLLGTPPDHPSRRPSDTFYIDDHNLLRTQTTTMWSYYLKDPANVRRLESDGRLLSLSYGKVYRNDEIDRYHYPVWHNLDGLCISKTSEKEFNLVDLVSVLVDVTKSIYGREIKWGMEYSSFPFTDPSIEIKIEWQNEWVAVLGAGIVHKKVLSLLNIDPDHYNGWAFGLGLDRLAMIRMNIPDIRILWSEDDRISKQFDTIDSVFREVSQYPPTDRDISMVVSKEVPVKAIYGLIRDCGHYQNEDIIEEVKLVDTYANEGKFGNGKVSHTFRIRYRSLARTLENSEINNVQELLRNRVKTEFNVLLR
ncbi:MAG: hypothetical protein ABSE95_07965 [Thermodesulfobacteriota bacterium]